MYLGYGDHACLGRVFAAVEIKVITARLLLEYGIKKLDDLTAIQADEI